MEPNKTCGYCGVKGHLDDQCPRRWRDDASAQVYDQAVSASQPKITWHARPGGSVAADYNGKVLGQVTHLDRGDTWTARAGAEFLGEYVSFEAATKAVERALGF